MKVENSKIKNIYKYGNVKLEPKNNYKLGYAWTLKSK